MRLFALLLLCHAFPAPGEVYFNNHIYPQIALVGSGNFTCTTLNTCISVSPCIECDMDGRLARIFMSGQNLAGSFSHNIFNATESLNLLYVTFSYNQLWGNVPWLPDGLRLAYLQHNEGLTGSINVVPTSLRILAISNTTISSIPAVLHDGFERLFAISCLSLTQTLPELPNSLITLKISGASLQGSLPPTLPAQLEELGAAAMPNLSGTLPSLLPEKLRELHVFRSQKISGTIPFIHDRVRSIIISRGAFSGYRPLFQNASTLETCMLLNTTDDPALPEERNCFNGCFVYPFLPSICALSPALDPCLPGWVLQCVTPSPTPPTLAPTAAPFSLTPSPTSTPATTSTSTSTSTTTTTAPKVTSDASSATASSSVALLLIIGAITLLTCLAAVLFALFIGAKRRGRRQRRPASSIIVATPPSRAGSSASHRTSRHASRRQSRNLSSPVGAYGRLPASSKTSTGGSYVVIPAMAPSAGTNSYENVAIQIVGNQREYEEAPDFD